MEGRKGSDKRNEKRKERKRGEQVIEKATEREICDEQLINDNKRVLTFKCPSKDSRCCCC